MNWKVLSLTQPYATLVALAARFPDLGKRIETRGWLTYYRGPLAIHAAKGLGSVGGRKGLIKLIEREPFWTVLCEAFSVQLCGEVHYPGDAETIANELPYGAIVATCDLYDCRSLKCEGDRSYYWDRAGYWVQVSDREAAFGDYTKGRYGFQFADIFALPDPIPANGAQRFWHWEGDLITEGAVTP